MVKRKSTIAKEKADEMVKKSEEIKALYDAAIAEAKEAEEAERLAAEQAREKIDAICKEGGYFCGARLSRDQILGIVKLAIETKDEVIVIPYALYFENT